MNYQNDANLGIAYGAAVGNALPQNGMTSHSIRIFRSNDFINEQQIMTTQPIMVRKAKILDTLRPTKLDLVRLKVTVRPHKTEDTLKTVVTNKASRTQTEPMTRATVITVNIKKQRRL